MSSKYSIQSFILAFFLVFLAGCTGLNPQTIQATAEAQAGALIARAETLQPTVPPTAQATTTPLPDKIVDSQGVIMRLVPAGEYKLFRQDLEDFIVVTISSFYMDVFEVTNADYRRCVDDGVCPLPTKSSSQTRPAYYGNPEFANYPVIYVDWNMAKTYCEWRGSRLPTEAEWEKAACGSEGCRASQPENIKCVSANYNACFGDTTPVGSYEKDKSPYGIYDMAGNVTELVNDWYSEYFYIEPSSTDPLGPSSEQYHVVRGDYWGVFIHGYLYRDSDSINESDNNTGFRCSSSP